jgi:uncharacterized membrane-anchored protein YitT (DUF2179 family)
MSRYRHVAASYAGIITGALLVALGLDWLLVPNRIVGGGASGLATIFYHLTGAPVGLSMMIINIPLFLLSIKIIGLRFGLKSVLGILSTSLFVDLLAPILTPITHEPVLASVYGGLIVGLGVGLTIRFGGSTGGTDMASQLLHRLTGLRVGRGLLLVDGLIIILAGIVFNPELALWSLLSVLITSKAIDLLLEGRSVAKVAFIISQQPQAIAAAILRDMDRGVTALAGRGMYSGQEKQVLFVIVGRHEIELLRSIVYSMDKRAFVVISDAHDVLGEGFQPVPGVR